MIMLKSLLEENEEVHFLGTNIGSDNDEVIITYNDDFDPIGAYVYKSSPLIKFDPDDWEVNNADELSKWNWKFRPGKNPLFFHVNGNIRSFVWWIKQLGYKEARRYDSV